MRKKGEIFLKSLKERAKFNKVMPRDACFPSFKTS